jgi:hypothetical protein
MNDSQSCGLARTNRAEIAKGLATLHGKADAIQRPHLPVVLREIVNLEAGQFSVLVRWTAAMTLSP